MNYADLFRATLPETVLEVAALLVLVVDLAFLRKATLKARVTAATFLGIAGCVAALWPLIEYGALSFPAIFSEVEQNAGFDWFQLGAGPIATVAQIGILILTALTLLLLIDSNFTRHVGEYVSVVLMSAAGGLLITTAHDLLVIFIGLELLSLGLYILTAFAKQSGASAEAAMKYYLFGGMSAAFLLFGFSYLYGLSGSTNLWAIGSAITSSGATPLLYVAWVLIVAGLGFKVAAVPFHLWAPDAYEGAPAPAAAFTASVSKVASFALLINISANMLMFPGPVEGARQAVEQYILNRYQIWPKLGLILLIVAAASMVVGNLAALAQTSVRRLLAYSAIAHAGYILLGIGVPASFGVPGTLEASVRAASNADVSSFNAVLYYILTYGLTTIGAFGVISVVERATGNDRLDSFLGLQKRNPLLAAVLLILFLSLAGIPPLVGFWAKFNLFAAVLGVSHSGLAIGLVALAIAMSAVSLYYYLQVLKRAYVMPAANDTPIHAHPVTMAVLVAIALAVVTMGCFPSLLQGWIDSFYR